MHTQVLSSLAAPGRITTTQRNTSTTRLPTNSTRRWQNARWRVITEQLVAEAIVRGRGDKNAYRIASHLSSMGYTLGTGDMNAIRDILGETHPDMRGDAKPREPKGRRDMSRNHMKKGEGTHPARRGGAA